MTEQEIHVWEVESFWRGYKWALAGQSPRFQNDSVQRGWGYGAVERDRMNIYPRPTLWKRFKKWL
jgi:hypothetical protein